MSVLYLGPFLDWSVHRGNWLYSHTYTVTHPPPNIPPTIQLHTTTTHCCSLSPVRRGGGALSQRWALQLCTVANQQKTQQNESTKLCFTLFPKEHTEHCSHSEKKNKCMGLRSELCLKTKCRHLLCISKTATYAKKSGHSHQKNIKNRGLKFEARQVYFFWLHRKTHKINGTHAVQWNKRV